MATPIDWASIVEKYRAALVSVVAALFTRAWLYEDGSPFVGEDVRAITLPRRVHRTVLDHLRAAESALRRIIVIAARGMTVTVEPPRLCARKPKPEPKPKGILIWDTDGKGGIISRYAEIKIVQIAIDAPVTATGTAPAADPAAPGGEAAPPETGPDTPIPAFALFDPRKSFAWWWRGDWYRKACGEDVPDRPRPAIAFAPPADPDEYVPAGHIALRLIALKKALDDIPGQARRLARLQARAKAGQPGQPSQRDVWRPGPPPGYREKREHAVDDILHNVNYFAHRAVKERPDTS